MKITWGTLWRPGGTVDRSTYALVGVVGFAIKHNLDRLVASWGFHRPWGVFNYWVPLRDITGITALNSDQARFLEALLAMALPFIWVGVLMTAKRLRSAALPSSLVALFFVPFLNLAFFLVLCAIPERTALSAVTPVAAGTSRLRLARFLPEGAPGSAAVALLITVPLGFGLTLLGTQVLANYGWGLFVALPYCMGFAAAMIYGARRPRSFAACVGVALLAIALPGALLLALAFEGLVCIVMAAPIAAPLAIFGGASAYAIQRRRWLQADASVLLSAVLLFTPGVQWAEHAISPAPPVFAVRSAVEIHASPEQVWEKVVAFSEIGPPKELLFRAGIAYPIRAEIAGSGARAERRCVFSTGAFVEPIQVWDQPRLLKFSVTSNPAPMEEWTPYRHIEPRHLHGFLVSNGGQFLLTPLLDGGTRLEGTTWYHHGLWPAAYWRIWSDAIIHRIHMLVLNHIRDEAEKG
jgi:hypothetical protein